VAGQSPLNGVLTAKASLPELSIPVSQGVSGGQLVHRVAPVYPVQARLQRLEGRVVLAAVIMEDGTLRDVRVIEGEPLLAQSAADAVQHWRYTPYELDGKPVKNLIRINVDFKLPGGGAR
jgi:protein TonB